MPREVEALQIIGGAGVIAPVRRLLVSGITVAVWTLFLWQVVPLLPVWLQTVVRLGLVAFGGYSLGSFVERGRRIKDAMRHTIEIGECREIVDRVFASERERMAKVNGALVELEWVMAAVQAKDERPN